MPTKTIHPSLSFGGEHTNPRRGRTPGPVLLESSSESALPFVKLLKLRLRIARKDIKQETPSRYILILMYPHFSVLEDSSL